jgi:hypothetical protein
VNSQIHHEIIGHETIANRIAAKANGRVSASHGGVVVALLRLLLSVAGPNRLIDLVRPFADVSSSESGSPSKLEFVTSCFISYAALFVPTTVKLLALDTLR